MFTVSTKASAPVTLVFIKCYIVSEAFEQDEISLNRKQCEIEWNLT